MDLWTSRNSLTVKIVVTIAIVSIFIAGQAYILLPSTTENKFAFWFRIRDNVSDIGDFQTSCEATSSLQSREIEQQSKLIASLTESIVSRREQVEALTEQLNKTTADFLVHKENNLKLVSSLRKTIKTLNETVQKGGKSDDQPVRLERFSDRPEVRAAIQDQIANASEYGDPLKSRLLPAENVTFWRQRTFKAHGTFGFLQYSGYRSGDRTFAAPGLHTKVLRKSRRLQGCTWFGKEGESQRGKLIILYEDEDFKEQYEVVVLKCEFRNPTSENGGYVVARVDNEEFVMYVDENDKDRGLSPSPSGPFKNQIAFCSTCLHDTLYPPHVWEFMEYHRVLHLIDHFYFYDGGALSPEVLKYFDPYLKGGLITVTDIREVLLFTVHYWGQTLAILDCVYRNRYTAKWLMMGDPDEYLHVKPPATLQSILTKYEEEAFISHQGLNWDINHCEKKTSVDQFTVERMVFRLQNFSCWIKEWNPNLCWTSFGHRKYFVNPRKVEIVAVHDIRGGAKGVNLYAGVDLWHHHFRGLGAASSLKDICNDSVNTMEDKDYVYDNEMALVFPLVRKCPLSLGRDCALEVSKKVSSIKKTENKRHF